MPPYFATENRVLTDGSTQEQWLSELQPGQLLQDALLIDRSDWDALKSSAPHVPDFERFPQLTTRDIVQLWAQQLPEFAQPDEYNTVTSHHRKHCIASHPLEIDDALAVLSDLLATSDGPSAAIDGSFCPVDVSAESHNSFYFDEIGVPVYPAFASRPPHSLLVAGQYEFRPIC
ncbi:MAG: hypothetical protein R3C19_04745 [Planctomycetaceae bacterium]